jgi:peptide subunit release factor 1 (eRF1)
MESAGPTPQVALDAATISSLFPDATPVATVYLTTEAEIENAAQRSEQHWKSLRGAMADAGVPAQVLDAVEAWVPDAHKEGQTLAVIATEAGGAHVVDSFAEPPATDVFRWGPLPWVGPILEMRQAAVPHVAVAIDRTGADIVVFRPGRDDLTEEVRGEASDPIRKAKPGGWSQPRYQQRAENTWQENAENVAEEVTRLVDRSGARLVVVTGDVRATQMLREALPAEVDDLVRLVDGDVEEEIVRLVDTLVASDTVALLEKFKEERGQADRAADGVQATITALNQSQVDVLLVHADPDDERTAWFGPDPVPVSLDPGELKALGVDSPTEGPLVDALLRAAAGTGAGARLIPHTPTVKDTVGAILRWA